MSYSRWSNSCWYTFWASYGNEDYSLPTKKRKRSQVFEICGIPSYYITYGDLQDKKIEVIIQEVKEFFLQEHNINLLDSFDNGVATYKETKIDPYVYTQDELEELKGYLESFDKDVNEHFKWSTFFYYEWWLPIRNKFKNRNK